MSIADKLQTIAENETRVYDKGYEDGINSGVLCERYADEIHFNNLNLFGKEELIFNLNSATYLSCFYTSKENMPNETVKHITINCPNQIKSLKAAFSGEDCPDSFLEHITLNFDTSKCAWWTYVFTGMHTLKIIDGAPLNPISCNDDGFMSFALNCNMLEEIRFAANSILYGIEFAQSSELSNDSIQSIIDGLADLTGSTTQTLTFHATVGNKLTDTQKATITAKNWILAY